VHIVLVPQRNDFILSFVVQEQKIRSSQAVFFFLAVYINTVCHYRQISFPSAVKSCPTPHPPALVSLAVTLQHICSLLAGYTLSARPRRPANYSGWGKQSRTDLGQIRLFWLPSRQRFGDRKLSLLVHGIKRQLTPIVLFFAFAAGTAFPG
jgi:hypothetical protein